MAQELLGQRVFNYYLVGKCCVCVRRRIHERPGMFVSFVEQHEWSYFYYSLQLRTGVDIVQQSQCMVRVWCVLTNKYGKLL